VGNERLIAVSDAGPLIHLAEIDSLSLLSIVEQLHIPQAVWQETVGQSRVSQAGLSVLRNMHSHTLPRSKVEQFVREHDLAELHAGERECLCLCRNIGASILLTDDLAVREATWRLRLQPVGSLGIVVRACLTKLISLTEAERRIVELYEVSSLYVTRTIVELAIQQLHKHMRNS
jgi:predicted nucleic acid-binding protein